jgi:hypothetical protein
MSTRVLQFPATEDIRERVAASVEASLSEVMGELAWLALRKQMVKLYHLTPEDLVYDYERFIASAATMLGRSATIILFPLVLAHLRKSFPGILEDVGAIEDVAPKLESVDPSFKVQSAVMEKMKSGDHAMVLYDSLEMKERIVNWFYKGAVEKNLMFVMVAGSPDRSNITGDLSSRALPVDAEAGRASLHSVRETFFYQYVFSPQQAVESLKGFAASAKKKGFRGTRIVLDNTGLLKYGEEGGLAVLEGKLGTKLLFPASVLCSYDQRLFVGKEKLRQRLVDAHSFVIVPSGFVLPSVDLGRPGKGAFNDNH